MNLKDIYLPVSDDLNHVTGELACHKEQIIGYLLNSGVEELNSGFVREIVGYFFDAPGKLLRPALVLLSANAAGGYAQKNTERLINLSVAAELIHGASLIHDDVIDESILRRGRATINSRFNNRTAILTGDILYAQAFSLLNSENPVFHLLCRTTQRMCYGEILELRMENSIKPVEFNDYLQIIENKTASLMSACSQAGALISGADARTTLALKEYGYNFGISYQLMDDFSDADAPACGTDIVKKAMEFAGRAKENIAPFGESAYKESLENLSAYAVEAEKQQCREVCINEK